MFPAGMKYAWVLAGVLGWATMAPAGPILFEDHFEGPVLSDAWVSLRPLQWVEDGWLHTRSNGAVPGRDSDAVVHEGDVTWTDYTVRLTVDPLPTFTWERAGVMFRMSRTALAPNGIFYEGYYLDLRGPADGIGPGLALVRVYADGASRTLASRTDLPATSEPWAVQVIAVGRRIVVELDGQRVFEEVDEDPALFGGIGIAAIWESHARFDDVVVAVPAPAGSCLLVLAGAGWLGGRNKQRRLPRPPGQATFGARVRGGTRV